ncbi:hypothetical protein Glove_481g17 [Diversispora epigaea]|uniref:Uncharacterized protein n=1 Tax=Diversispora epigaea TaxID=1348612 RepID=A0A397GT75_9GLOM|nr:hypothetical protein Glove_481g17 [Diversispora epigaea]
MSENHIKTIVKPNISAQLFKIILNEIINIENLETKIIYELMIVANESELKELLEKIGKLPNIREKVKPYREILGKNLWKDLNQHLLFPNQPVKSLVLPARIISTPELPPKVMQHFQLSSMKNI